MMKKYPIRYHGKVIGFSTIAPRDFCHDINQSGAWQVNYQSIGINEVNIGQTKAIIQVSTLNKGIRITAEDDGKGFNPVILEGSGGIGWSNIQSRIEYLKGKVDVQSGPEKELLFILN